MMILFNLRASELLTEGLFESAFENLWLHKQRKDDLNSIGLFEFSYLKGDRWRMPQSAFVTNKCSEISRTMEFLWAWRIAHQSIQSCMNFCEQGSSVRTFISIIERVMHAGHLPSGREGLLSIGFCAFFWFNEEATLA
jgi:hypothetical protein